MATKKEVKEVKKENSLNSGEEQKLERMLIENSVSLQKVMTNLVIKIDDLSSQMSKLLQLFEISAKALAEKDFDKLETGDNKQMLEKLDRLLEQNKVIAKGLTLMHENNSVNNNLPQRPPIRDENYKRSIIG
ncbi:MAG: hypothetical protein Q7R52_03470 [archaeon]|nr:hypothetical protein [archaeon]